ncbi:hypothetical protein ACFO9Q_21410 [Paenibacillus sp. GCM10023252]|uniref:alpha-L-rhamnosidase-related protein n=1 Tax=Paenibacillus sp. GCM10023252 TaxID=3252649 RepID=UPI0036210B8F
MEQQEKIALLTDKPDKVRAIWTDPEGQGRNLFARFKLTLKLDARPEEALLHLFADTSYQLYVNGNDIGSGPVRFDPRYPLYDTHELSQHLKPGRNVIAVQVNYVGHKSFITMLSQAGFMAWGGIAQRNGPRIDLATGTAPWLASEAPAYRYAAKASLFLKAADLYDQRLDHTDWHIAEGGDTPWKPAVELGNQEVWGALKPRSIPYMSGTLLQPERVLHVLPLAQREEVYSFSVPMPHVNEIHEPDQNSRFYACTTWIYTPEACTVTMGLYYQHTWVNGKPLEAGVPSQVHSMRLNHRVQLHEGWNYYMAAGEALQDMVHHYLALPKGAGLLVSAERDSGCGTHFRRTPVLAHEVYDRLLRSKLLPYSPEDNLEEIGGWIPVFADEQGTSPQMGTGWDCYGEPWEQLTPNELEGHTFHQEDYPEGFSVLIDLGMTRLTRPRLLLEGAGGAVADLTYSEHLNADQQHLRHYHWYGLGDRAIGADHQALLDWRITQPRGFRYLQLTVRKPQRDIILRGLELRSASYPAEQKGRFHCSDPLLNEIWAMGARTQAVNMEDGYTDCVTRERGQYIRDTNIQYHNNLVLFGDHALMRRCLELVGQSPDTTGKFRAVYPNTGDYTISDFALNALEGFGVYYEQTGDRELIEQYWEAITRNLSWFHELADERDDLLLDSEWDVKRGVKAHYGGFHGDLAITDGYMDSTGVHCVFSCTYLIALRWAARLAGVIGREQDQAELERRMNILESSIRRVLWDEDKGCYSDNPTRSTHSVHASLFAARAGVMTEEQRPRVMRHVKEDLRSLFVNGYGPEQGVYVSPSFSFYIFEGLYLLGLADVAEHMMRQGWGWFLQQGLRQTPEYYDLSLSLCHAWSACPTYFLSKHVLGVHLPTVNEPDEVILHVDTSGVSSAEGTVPHARGLIEVKWHKDENGDIHYDEIRLPEGMRAIIR